MVKVSNQLSHKLPKVWQSLETCLPPGDPDTQFWWQLTGYQLAHMVDAAGYTIERQYEILLFHYHWVILRLGPAPDANGCPQWTSLMAHEGSPLEYSWKWNTAGSEADIRYSWEPFNPGSRGTGDPLNHALSVSFMQRVGAVVPGVDFTWATKLLAEIETGHRAASHFLHAVEFHRTKEFTLKSYFMPRNSELLHEGDPTTLEEWWHAVEKLGTVNASRDVLMDFIKNNPEGQVMVPVVLAVDDVPPSQSRLKVYFMTPHTSFASLREIMTMGGSIGVPEASLQEICSLIETILGLPSDYPEHRNMPHQEPLGNTWVDVKGLVDCFVYFFDIAPGREKPDVKFYLPTRSFGPDDLTICHRLMQWMSAHGRGAYCDNYLAMMKVMGEHRGLENGKGIHSFISYQANAHGEADIKSYFTPEVYHPARYTKIQQQQQQQHAS
ncbi:aromatic prenyltransferase [Xylaria castorea]|nr:aromatic prenyltransferase [Xylaria castorea]